MPHPKLFIVVRNTYLLLPLNQLSTAVVPNLFFRKSRFMFFRKGFIVLIIATLVALKKEHQNCYDHWVKQSFEVHNFITHKVWIFNIVLVENIEIRLYSALTQIGPLSYVYAPYLIFTEFVSRFLNVIHTYVQPVLVPKDKY